MNLAKKLELATPKTTLDLPTTPSGVQWKLNRKMHGPQATEIFGPPRKKRTTFSL
jgi:hypothetical protein